MSEGLVVANRYRLVRKLGAGGMGSVWLAQDMSLNTDVAVKLIDPAFAESPEALARFQREAQAAAAIRSTHVVQTLEYGVDGQLPFIAMELLKGESLSDRLGRVGRLSPSEVAHVMGHVGRALAIAHKHGIVHRDLKPDNIFLVDEEGDQIAKVLDFGIARKQSGLGANTGLKTRTGAILGTPYYMSPEQATGQAVDHLTDIWSYGVIAFECLTGCRAFDGETLGALFHAVCMAELPIPSTQFVVPRRFDAWFARATARNKPERFQSIKDAADELRALCSENDQAVVAPSNQSVPDESLKFARTAPAPSPTLGHTAPPASQTISRSPKRRVNLALVIALPVLAILGTAFYFGLKHWSEPTPAGVASDTVVEAPVVQKPTPAATPSTTATALPVPPPIQAQLPSAEPVASAPAPVAPTAAKPPPQRGSRTPKATSSATAPIPDAPKVQPTHVQPATVNDNVAGF